MTTQYLVMPAKQAFFDSAGSLLVGGKLYAYDAGTSTLKTTYQDRGGSTANTNPIVLDARGECTLYGTGNYRLKLTDANDVLIWDRDNVAVNTEYDTSGRYLGTQVFTASGTYVPTAGMGTCVIEAQGGGGAGGGSGGAGVGNVSLGAPGASGAYAKGKFTAAQIGASKTVTVGAAGAGAASSTGGTGGSSSVGSLIIAPGGPGGGISINVAAPSLAGNGSGSPASTGGNIVSVTGLATVPSVAYSASLASGGPGGPSQFGQGGGSPPINTNGVSAGSNYGAGGSGTVVNQAGGNATGGSGAAGIVIIHEYA